MASLSDVTGQTGTADPASSPSLLQLVAEIVSRWRLIAGCALVAAVVAAAWSLLQPPSYRASGTFALEEVTMPDAGGLALLAGQLGGLANGGRSLQFHAQLLRGPTLLRQLASDSFADPGAPEARRPLVELLDIDGETAEERQHAAVQYLSEEAIATSIDDQSGTITFDVNLPDADLAAAVAHRLFDRLVQYNLETRNSAASERLRFAERELARTRGDLLASENVLRDFLQANRGGLESPRLALKRGQLQRQVSVLGDVYTQLAAEVQQARIDEVRDTPVLTLVETPTAPLRRESPRRTRMTLVGLVLGGAAGIAWVVLSGVGRRLRELDPVAYDRLRHPWRRRHA